MTTESIIALLQKFPRGMPVAAIADHLHVDKKTAGGRLSKLAAYGVVIRSTMDGPRAIYKAKATP